MGEGTATATAPPPHTELLIKFEKIVRGAQGAFFRAFSRCGTFSDNIALRKIRPPQLAPVCTIAWAMDPDDEGLIIFCCYFCSDLSASPSPPSLQTREEKKGPPRTFVVVSDTNMHLRSLLRRCWIIFAMHALVEKIHDGDTVRDNAEGHSRGQSPQSGTQKTGMQNFPHERGI